MKRIKCVLPATMLVLLSGCGYFGGDEKQQLEQAWLAQDPQLQQVVEQIRANGLDVVAQSAAAGTVSACVAEKLSQDPLGKLVNVEGSLVESAKVAELLGDLQKVMEQDISFDQVASLLQKGADAAAYAKSLIEQQGLDQALQSLKQMATASEQFAQQDLGAHFQQLLLECKTVAPTPTPAPAN
ncbi:hypothetical protein [Shewanella baltica]|uniref:hypothetical protein n=1 Tax=Shewanella baltica TaxID=62322 RepID=UPI0001530878|nr:hypothetical protein [Shewanella baltica]ACK47412.1 putative lipoprotein [Shewanella baltica OS223]